MYAVLSHIDNEVIDNLKINNIPRYEYASSRALTNNLTYAIDIVGSKCYLTEAKIV